VLTVVIFALVFLFPVLAAFGLVLWRRFVCHDEAAGAVVTGVAMGLLLGVVMGGAVTGLLVGLAILIARARH
jgi:hypothetical protein